ncbi:unnamed protein product [Meganyctiphanes norvegica]|uniref:Molybdopterin synthase sulfur carrier subunit n=1 Tax=Meganyctiphanes norvegica TaxID=48144 RepID=A0AAV2SM39_MEGNR
MPYSNIFLMAESATGRVSIHVVFFAGARERCGVNSASVSLSTRTDMGSILTDLYKIYPDLAELHNGLIVAHNHEYCTPGQPFTLAQGDEIAIIPPISGG